VNYVQRNAHKKKEKVTVVTDVIKDDDVEQEIDDASLFALKSEKLVQALALMDPKDKMILLMKYQDDMSIKEIKEALDIGESAVKMRIKRAKQKVVSIYGEL
jgi:RNA polymerase sigma-70 factor (ECF subfamily)